MSKPVLPWSLKGVSPEAREIAKKAAAQQGITIGEWVSRAIRDVGPDQASGTPPEASQTDSSQTSDAISSPVSPEMDEDAVREAVRARIYDSEERVAHMVGPLQDIIERLSRRMSRIEEIEEKVEDSPAPPVEQTEPRRLDGW